MSTKEVILAKLASGPLPREQLFEDFHEAAQIRGAASVLSYLVRSGQVVETGDGFSLTGQPAQKLSRQQKTRFTQPVAQVAEPESTTEPEPKLELAAWHTGELTVRRGDQVVLLSPAEVETLLLFAGRMLRVED